MKRGAKRCLGNSQRTSSISSGRNITDRSESAVELENVPNTLHNLLNVTTASSGEALDGKRIRGVPLNRELEPIDSEDWNWLKTKDAAIRKRRRFAGGDGSPITFEGACPEAEVSKHIRGLQEEIARKKLNLSGSGNLPGSGIKSKNFGQVSGDHIDTLFELYPSQQSDDELDSAQLQFEQELEKEQKDILLDGTPDDSEETVKEELDDWFERVERNSSDEISEFDWKDLSFEADEFDEAPSRDGLSHEVRTGGRISRESRALQEATQLAQEYDWDEHGVKLLAEVFERYFWSSAKASMRREIEGGMTPEELELALGLRDFWRGRTEFSIDLRYRRSKGRLDTNTSRAIYHVLSWPAALRLIRMANSIPDQAEIEVFLDDLYCEWYLRNSLHRLYPSFRGYLYRLLDYLEKRSDLVGAWSARIDSNREAEFNDGDECELAWLAHHRYELACEGFLPIGGDDPYVEMMSLAERGVFGEVLAARSELCP